MYCGLNQFLGVGMYKGEPETFLPLCVCVRIKTCIHKGQSCLQCPLLVLTSNSLYYNYQNAQEEQAMRLEVELIVSQPGYHQANIEPKKFNFIVSVRVCVC